ncbi:MAG TPA: TetR/AcrR family transcriptional regulator [Niabella sp.]|nr:TetR/AcrR family transcriptional regulator [Niabella sp.]HOZ97272.1 TetR/AcrR family transcriptional regulator [Niabella sp.]HQW15457.1 TetR/AcrR family transcriptional regulator [Niabella sp.]HQX20497.1 TetR/AcrR family transcriptional regulator [Niabella sp.]HQX41708.1 TetR/AcrR family transcriptional regulator [Niabella sp.]
MKKKDLLKHKIGEAAMQCFQKYGLEKTTLDDIAKVVGLNKASLYYYYKNKEDIFVEAALGEGEKFILELQQKTTTKKGLEAKVWFYLDSRFRYYINALDFGKIAPQTLNKILPRFFELYDEFRKKEIIFLATILKKGMEEGSLEKSNPNKMASLLMDLSDALKHSMEQRTILKGSNKVDYSICLQDIKYLLTLILRKKQ